MATYGKAPFAQEKPLLLDPTPLAALTQPEQHPHPPTKTPMVATAAFTEAPAGLKLGSPGPSRRRLISVGNIYEFNLPTEEDLELAAGGRLLGGVEETLGSLWCV